MNDAACAASATGANAAPSRRCPQKLMNACPAVNRRNMIGPPMAMKRRFGIPGNSRPCGASAVSFGRRADRAPWPAAAPGFPDSPDAMAEAKSVGFNSALLAEGQFIRSGPEP